MSTPRPAASLSLPVKVDERSFLGLLWAGTGVSLCFLLFRLFVKVKSFRKLYSDDYLVILAWSMLLGTAVVWQVEAPTLYEQYAITSGQKAIEPGFIERETTFLRTLVPFNTLFYSCLWTVKLSFMLFFRRLGSKVKGYTIWWWCILVVTVLTWVACIADYPYKCALDSIELIMTYCPSSASIHYDNRTFYANCTADVVTDCLIISIPVLMLWNVRVPLRKKLILMAIFSLTVIVMIVSVIRIALVPSTKRDADISWLYLWSNIEMTTTIIISCLASFRQLFTHAHNQQIQGQPNGSASNSRRGLFSFLRSRGKSLINPGSHTREPTHGDRRQDPSDRSDSRIRIVPLDSIHVTHNIDISSTDIKFEDQREVLSF